ncbi:MULTISPECIES: ATP-binding protein [Mesorhizobium]|uniref:ATP-binding protein n=1 Tax=Mesorhizobium TaxID=68287 RepID=UPI0010A96B78|nr:MULTISPECIES: ATP-binding protein [Mesorhizobium]
MSSKLVLFPFMPELGGFNFYAHSSLDQWRSLPMADRVLCLGPPSRGKPHLAVSLGREAIRQNYNVQFLSREPSL